MAVLRSPLIAGEGAAAAPGRSAGEVPSGRRCPRAIDVSNSYRERPPGAPPSTAPGSAATRGRAVTPRQRRRTEHHALPLDSPLPIATNSPVKRYGITPLQSRREAARLAQGERRQVQLLPPASNS